jgi:glycosyltransferase involved in cell wall biosynthesis
MRVTFVLPAYKARPVGGYLVVFRYANALAERGHVVRIVHSRQSNPDHTLKTRARSRLALARHHVLHSGGRPAWFQLDLRVEVTLTPDLRESTIPDGDAIFATACTTAPAVANYSSTKGVKLYLIQHYEDWVCGKERVDATWRLPFHKVVSSAWLEQIGLDMGERDRLTHIPYGVELESFRITTDPVLREPRSVGMLAHSLPWKGMDCGIQALEEVRQGVPGLKVVAFGASARPASLPNWMAYVENPSRPELAGLYNSLAIFVHTSDREGWGLTGAESLACGCALVATDSGGVRDYARESDTALIVAPGDPSAIARGVRRLIDDNAFRLSLAYQGNRAIQDFTWSRAADRMEGLLRAICPQDQPIS